MKLAYLIQVLTFIFCTNIMALSTSLFLIRVFNAVFYFCGKPVSTNFSKGQGSPGGFSGYLLLIFLDRISGYEFQFDY